MKKVKMVFKLFTYDLWADCEGGMSVNDVFPQGEITVNALPDFGPTDLQLNRAIGARGLSWDGEADYTLYATDRKGNPACELRRVS